MTRQDKTRHKPSKSLLFIRLALNHHKALLESFSFFEKKGLFFCVDMHPVLVVGRDTRGGIGIKG